MEIETGVLCINFMVTDIDRRHKPRSMSAFSANISSRAQ